MDRFLDAIWMERGLSKNTLGAYRADLMTLGRWLAETTKSIDNADKADLLNFIASASKVAPSRARLHDSCPVSVASSVT